MGAQSHCLPAICCAIAWVAVLVQAAEPPAAALPQIDRFTPPDLSWVPRTVSREPAYASKAVRYCLFVLGDGRKSVMTLAWDESGGTGSGYDTLYADANCNGDLAETPEKHFWANRAKGPKGSGPYESYDVTAKETNGDRVFTFKLRNVYDSDSIQYNSEYSMSSPSLSYSVGPLPNNHLILWGADLKSAPVYWFGGPAVPQCNGKPVGEPLGTWEAGRTVTASLITAHYGDPVAAQLRFYGSRFPGLAAAVRQNRWGRAAYPFVLLRVLKADGATAEEIPFGDSCPCAGGFAPELTIPSRVPPGEHKLVVRMLRQEALGGPADFLWPVKVANPDYGKPMADPAYAALRAAFPGADVKFATLRRVTEPLGMQGSYPQERVVPAQAADNVMDPTNRDWDPRPINYGAERTLWIGLRIHFHDKSRGMLRFDLDGVPKGCEILGAQVRLTLLNEPFSGLPADARIEAVAIRRDWLETPQDGKWAAWHGPKWQGKSGEAWAEGGCKDTKLDCFPEPAGAAAVGEWPLKLDPKDASRDAPRERRRLVAMDLTDLVRRWHAGKQANHGVLLVVPGGGSVVVCTSEFLDPPFRPALVIAYRGADPEPRFPQSLAAEVVEDLSARCRTGPCAAPP